MTPRSSGSRSSEKADSVPRELLVLSSRPVDPVDVLAAGVPDNAGVRTVWDRGAWQLLDDAERPLVTIVRSHSVESVADVSRWGPVMGAPEPGAPLFLTELYLGVGPAADRVGAALISALDGVVVSAQEEPR